MGKQLSAFTRDFAKSRTHRCILSDLDQAYFHLQSTNVGTRLISKFKMFLLVFPLIHEYISIQCDACELACRSNRLTVIRNRAVCLELAEPGSIFLMAKLLVFSDSECVVRNSGMDGIVYGRTSPLTIVCLRECSTAHGN